MSRTADGPLADLDALLAFAGVASVDDLLDWLWSYGGYELDVVSFPPMDGAPLCLGFQRHGVNVEFPTTLRDITDSLKDLHEELEAQLEDSDDD